MYTFYVTEEHPLPLFTPLQHIIMWQNLWTWQMRQQ